MVGTTKLFIYRKKNKGPDPLVAWELLHLSQAEPEFLTASEMCSPCVVAVCKGV